MTTSEGRIKLIQEYGSEIVIKCCREWKTHFGNGKWGMCGICKTVPVLINGKTWEESINNE